MNRFTSGDEMVTDLFAYTFKPRMHLCKFWLKKIILLLLMFAKNKLNDQIFYIQWIFFSQMRNITETLMKPLETFRKEHLGSAKVKA